MRWRKASCLFLTSIGLLAFCPEVAINREADAKQLVREVMNNELKAQAEEAGDDHLWSYRELTRQKGKNLLFDYCETKYGTIHRLLAVNGHPLSQAQSRAEDKRIQQVIKSPASIREASKKERSDAEQERKFLTMFADAFRFQEEGRQGDIVRIRFTPDPDFHPSGIEQRVLHVLSGTIAVDVKERRLASINGRLVSEVRFLGGLVGHLNAGGTFSAQSERVAPGDWELKSLDIDMNGKLLLFKTLEVQEHKAYSGYTPVPPSTTLAQAAERLQRDSSLWSSEHRSLTPRIASKAP